MPDNPQDLVDQALGTAPVTPIAPPPVAPPPFAPPVVLPVAPPSPAPNVTVGDETPLAFMTPPPSQTIPVTQPASSPPLPSPSPEVVKKKGGKGKIFGLVIGFFLLLAGIGGGYYYYTNYMSGAPSLIAGVYVDGLTKELCNGCYNGGNLVWRNGACKMSGTCSGSGGGNPVTTVVACGTTGSVQCDACGGFCIIPIDKTCNEMGVIKCGETPVTGASCSTSGNTQFFKSCNCAGTSYYFDVEGICDSKDPKAIGTTDPLYYDTYGLCAVAKNGCNGGGGADQSCQFTCTTTGCSCTGTDPQCSVYHWKCDRNTDLAGGCQDGTPTVGKSASFNSNCGSEQIDVRCGAASVGSRTKAQTTACGKVTPSKPPTSPSPSPTYTMSCTGITKNVATPVIGSKITFTCAGATVPATGASLLKYNFRYNIDSGAWTPLANKTNTTTELTVAACGSYGVQCRACITVGGATQCDPIWTGATTP